LKVKGVIANATKSQVRLAGKSHHFKGPPNGGGSTVPPSYPSPPDTQWKNDRFLLECESSLLSPAKLFDPFRLQKIPPWWDWILKLKDRTPVKPRSPTLSDFPSENGRARNLNSRGGANDRFSQTGDRPTTYQQKAFEEILN
jgi:hypothetical protein